MGPVFGGRLCNSKFNGSSTTLPLVFVLCSNSLTAVSRRDSKGFFFLTFYLTPLPPPPWPLYHSHISTLTNIYIETVMSIDVLHYCPFCRLSLASD